MVDVAGMVLEMSEKLVGHLGDPESRAAGAGDPHYPVSDKVTVSNDDGMFVYHVGHDQLGAGSSLGNRLIWAETKGNGDPLGLFSIAAGVRIVGGLALTYQLPFTDLSLTGSADRAKAHHHRRLARALPSSMGRIHIHPCYQQREFILGDGLEVLETFYLPSTGGEDLAAAYTIVALTNRRPHPVSITVIVTVNLRGHTARDLQASYDRHSHALLASNASKPDWVRFFGADMTPDHYWATCDEEEAYDPGWDFPDETSEEGDLIGAMQFDLLLLPHQSRKLRLITGFSLEGDETAASTFRVARDASNVLGDTIDDYRRRLDNATIELPDDVLTQGVQWAKTCMVRPLAEYPQGWAFTNDPGHSSNIVGRDAAWFVHGCDFLYPEMSCSLLNLLREHQRGDGLIREYVSGITGEVEDHGFNINDNTPLYILAVAHHIAVTGHSECLERFEASVRRAAELILEQRNDLGLVSCRADGLGAKGICSWRNVLEHDQINGAVTELNAECYAALQAVSRLLRFRGDAAAADRYASEAHRLRELINEHLVDHRTDLYIRNIDLQGRVYTQATVDMIFPLIFDVADEHRRQVTAARLSAPDFMTSGGVRVLPDENPRFDPSEASGLHGGVWPGVTWWFAMGAVSIHPGIAAASLRQSYEYLIRDPRTFDTVPGQFNEWSDGRTLVNRGMRLSPWAPPRYLWVAIEGLAGVHINLDGITVNPNVPSEWRWLRVHNLPCKGGRLGFVLVCGKGRAKLLTANDFQSDIAVERYESERPGDIETLVTGVSATLFERQGEFLLFLGNSRGQQMNVPVLTHKVLRGSTHYRVSRLDSMESDWRELGEMEGANLHRLTARIESKGFTLYRFREV